MEINIPKVDLKDYNSASKLIELLHRGLPQLTPARKDPNMFAPRSKKHPI